MVGKIVQDFYFTILTFFIIYYIIITGIKKEKRYFIMAIIGIALIFGIIYVGSQILFDIFFGGKK